MKSKFSKIISVLSLLTLLSACARDLSSSMYTSDSTLSLTMEGVIVSSRAVVIKNNDRLDQNAGGMLAGGVAGGVAGAGLGGSGSSQNMATVGGALVGGLAGAVIQQQLGKAKGYEYIVKVDTSKLKDTYFDGNAAMRNVVATAKLNGLVTVVQGEDNVLHNGQKVYIIYSENRTRVIPVN